MEIGKCITKKCMQGRILVLRDFQRFMFKSLTQEIKVLENASSSPQEACTYCISRVSFSLALQAPLCCQIGRTSSIPTFCFWVKNDFWSKFGLCYAKTFQKLTASKVFNSRWKMKKNIYCSKQSNNNTFENLISSDHIGSGVGRLIALLSLCRELHIRVTIRITALACFLKPMTLWPRRSLRQEMTPHPSGELSSVFLTLKTLETSWNKCELSTFGSGGLVKMLWPSERAQLCIWSYLRFWVASQWWMRPCDLWYNWSCDIQLYYK